MTNMNMVRTSYTELGGETYAGNYAKISIGVIAAITGVLAVICGILCFMMI